MKSINIRNVRNGILQGICNNLVNMILPFITRTVILNSLGADFLGIGGLFSSVLQVLNLSELGVGAAISFMLYKPVAEGDVKHVNCLLNFYRKCYLIIGCVVLTIGIIILPFIKIIIKGEIPTSVNIYVLYLIYLSQSVLSYFLFAYKNVLLTANQRYDIFVLVQTITRLFTSIAQIVLLILFRNYYFYVIVLPASAILQNLLDYFFVNKLFPQYKPEGELQKEEVHLFKKNVVGAFSMKIGEVIYLSADQIVISAFIGLSILGIYGNYYYIISAVVSIFAIVHNTLRPILGKEVAIKTIEENYKEFKILNYAYNLTAIWCTSCLYSLYQPFMKVWVGESNMLTNNMVLLFSVYFFTGRITAMLGLYRDGAGKWWQGKYISLIAGFGNLFINIILVNLIGLPGILISSIICSVLIILPGYSWVMFKYYFSEKNYFVKFVIDMFFIIFDCIIVCFFNDKILGFIPNDGVVWFIIRALCCGAFALILIAVTNIWNKNFREYIHLVKRLINDKK